MPMNPDEVEKLIKKGLRTPDYSKIIKDMTPELAFIKTRSKPPQYEDTFFAQMADDIKKPLEQQISALEELVEISRNEATSAKRESRDSKIIAVVSIIISVATAVVPFIA